MSEESNLHVGSSSRRRPCHTTGSTKKAVVQVDETESTPFSQSKGNFERPTQADQDQVGKSDQGIVGIAIPRRTAVLYTMTDREPAQRSRAQKVTV